MEKQNSGGGVGGVRDGRAARHNDPKLDNPRDPIGWLPKAAAKSDPRGGNYVPIGPNTAAWDQAGRSTPVTTGAVGGGKPKR